eukprot:scaffold86909_cov32-Prasinocladus_malaysianus.AAC.2
MLRKGQKQLYNLPSQNIDSLKNTLNVFTAPSLLHHSTSNRARKTIISKLHDKTIGTGTRGQAQNGKLCRAMENATRSEGLP